MKILKQSEIKEYREANTPAFCPILGLPLDKSNTVLDHDHKTGRIRGGIHLHANALMGKIENYLNTFLAKEEIDIRLVMSAMCDWMSSEYSNNPYHPSHKRTMLSKFRAMNASDQKKWLIDLDIEPGNNTKVRSNQFKSWIRKHHKMPQDTSKNDFNNATQ